MSQPAGDRKPVATTGAPAAIGPYSQAIVAGGFVFTAGQVALHPGTGQMVGAGDVVLEAEQVFANLRAVLEAAGSSLAQAVRCDVFLADLADFARVNEVYARHVPSPAPARVTTQAAALPRGARVEIAVIARL
ncbi:MAG: Rid family detoxifying hydrolase [Planctomycetia bacterium]